MATTAHIRLTRKPSQVERVRLMSALGQAAWVIRVTFRGSELYVEHSQGNTDSQKDWAMLHLVAEVKITVPGLAVNE